jgi:hypothetical protein
MTDWEWDFGLPPGEELVKFDLLMPRAEFRPAGSIDGIPLVEHTCKRPCRVTGVTWVSAEPSADDDPYRVPFCGCRPIDPGYVAGSSHLKRKTALDAAGIPYVTYEFVRDDEPAADG